MGVRCGGVRWAEQLYGAGQKTLWNGIITPEREIKGAGSFIVQEINISSGL